MLSLIPWKRNGSLAGGTWMLPLDSASSDVDAFLNRLVAPWPEVRGANDPLRIEVRETEEAYVVRAEVPGIEPKDLDIQLDGDVLTLSGEKKDERTGESGGASYSERAYGSFRRALRLATAVDMENVRAEHQHGVVTITLPKAESARPRRIQVVAG